LSFEIRNKAYATRYCALKKKAMKKNFTLIAVLVSFLVQGQTWIDSGAKWYYYWSGNMPGFDKIEYVGDTIVQNKNIQKLEITSYMFAPLELGGELINTWYNYQYAYISGDTVFYLVNDQFHILYNFAAEIGESWNLGVDTNDFLCGPSIVEVQSKGSSIIHGDTLEWISVITLPGSSVGLAGKIYKRFGATDDYLFPTPRNCDPDMVIEFFDYTFSCFQDDTFPLLNVTEKDCDYLLYTQLSEVEQPDKVVSIFPNPSSNKLTIQLLKPNKKINSIQIIDLQGRTLKSLNQREIDNSDLPNGIYFLWINFENNEKIIKKIIKN
jgi:hypothetical protein